VFFQQKGTARNGRKNGRVADGAEVARRLRVDDTTVRRWITSGVLDAITLPHRGKRRQYRIRKSTLDALLTPPQPE
jgi:excisionase family DNA binding protein